jgi:uncharacterized protein (DUF2147 family)
MKKMVLLIVSCLLLVVVFAQEVSGTGIIGKWYTVEDKSIVEIRQVNDKFIGNIVWLKEPMEENDPTKAKVDDENPDVSLRARPIVGVEFLKDFKYDDKSNKWVDGVIYNPEDGKTYYCFMLIEKDGRLFVRGSIDAWGWVGKTQYWTRTPSVKK